MELTINFLPNEILVMIFKELKCLRDIGTCAQICLRWKDVIASMFRDNSKIVVTGQSCVEPSQLGVCTEIFIQVAQFDQTGSYTKLPRQS